MMKKERQEGSGTVRIKVLHVVRPSEGGIRNHLLSLLGESDSRRFEHMVACPEGMAQYFVPLGVQVYSVALRGEISPVSDVAAIKTLYSLLRKNRVDIVHAHGSKAGLVGRLAALLAGSPLRVLTVHNTIFHDHLPRWKVNMLAASERFLAGYTARIITVSGALREELVRREGIGPESVVTVYNGIDPGPFTMKPDRRYLESVAGIPPGRRVVGTVARLARQKGLIYLIGAAARLASGIDDLVFVIVGDGPLRENLESESIRLNLGGKLFFIGLRPDVNRLMPCFDVFVLPSVSEGLPLTILEAMAAGRPVVATRVGGIPEVVKDGVNGLLVSPGDVEGLARAIENMIRHGDRAESMGRAAREMIIKYFTSARMARETERVYSGLVYGERL